jgi:hypothetical protein
MQHQQVVEDHLVEQYLLHEMTPALRDEFEEHYFDCRECAADLKATAAFLDATREELKLTKTAQAPVISSRTREVKEWWSSLWTPAFAFAAVAACLLVIVYQNVLVYPRLNKEVAELRAPEVVPTVSLIGAATRGGETPSTALSGAHTIMLQLDIPTQPQFTGYQCKLYSPAQDLVAAVDVSPQQARDTVNLRVSVPAGQFGQYSLVVYGNEATPGAASGIDLAHYRFSIKASSTGSGN